jgi:hypothetical protein
LPTNGDVILVIQSIYKRLDNKNIHTRLLELVHRIRVLNTRQNEPPDPLNVVVDIKACMQFGRNDFSRARQLPRLSQTPISISVLIFIVREQRLLLFPTPLRSQCIAQGPMKPSLRPIKTLWQLYVL